MTVVFQDALKVRPQLNQGNVRDRAGMGLVALHDACGAMAAVDAVLARYKFEAIYSSQRASVQSEEQAATQERFMEDTMENSYQQIYGQPAPVRADYPNALSWVVLEPSGFTPELGKRLILDLQEVSAVRLAFMSNYPSPAYRLP